MGNWFYGILLPVICVSGAVDTEAGSSVSVAQSVLLANPVTPQSELKGSSALKALSMVMKPKKVLELLEKFQSENFASEESDLKWIEAVFMTSSAICDMGRVEKYYFSAGRGFDLKEGISQYVIGVAKKLSSTLLSIPYHEVHRYVFPNSEEAFSPYVLFTVLKLVELSECTGNTATAENKQKCGCFCLRCVHKRHHTLAFGTDSCKCVERVVRWVFGNRLQLTDLECTRLARAVLDVVMNAQNMVGFDRGDFDVLALLLKSLGLSLCAFTEDSKGVLYCRYLGKDSLDALEERRKLEEYVSMSLEDGILEIYAFAMDDSRSLYETDTLDEFNKILWYLLVEFLRIHGVCKFLSPPGVLPLELELRNPVSRGNVLGIYSFQDDETCKMEIEMFRAVFLVDRVVLINLNLPDIEELRIVQSLFPADTMVSGEQMSSQDIEHRVSCPRDHKEVTVSAYFREEIRCVLQDTSEQEYIFHKNIGIRFNRLDEILLRSETDFLDLLEHISEGADVGSLSIIWSASAGDVAGVQAIWEKIRRGSSTMTNLQEHGLLSPSVSKSDKQDTFEGYSLSGSNIIALIMKTTQKRYAMEKLRIKISHGHRHKIVFSSPVSSEYYKYSDTTLHFALGNLGANEADTILNSYAEELVFEDVTFSDTFDKILTKRIKHTHSRYRLRVVKFIVSERLYNRRLELGNYPFSRSYIKMILPLIVSFQKYDVQVFYNGTLMEDISRKDFLHMLERRKNTVEVNKNS